MSGTNRSTSFFVKLLIAICMGASCCVAIRAETIDVHTVIATEPGKPGTIPTDLAKFRVPLGSSAFSKFSSGGMQSVSLTANAPKSAVLVGGFTLELSRQAAAKVDVTVKETTKNGSKTVFGPITYLFNKEKTKQLELPTLKGAYIVFLTLEKE